MSVILQPRDEQLLQALVWAVRFFSASQVASLWGREHTNTCRRLRKLMRAGLIEQRCILASLPPEDLAEPLCCWNPRAGQPLPHAGKLSWRARKRYLTKGLPRHLIVYRATPSAYQYLGSLRRPVTHKPSQASHDLAVSSLFLHYAKAYPQVATLWRGEDTYARERRSGESVEDALLLRADKPLLAIEVGAYRPERYSQLFADLQRRAIPFRCH